MVREVLRRMPHPEQGFRSCLGIIRLADRYGTEKLESACRRARAIASPSYRSLSSILKNGLESQPLPPRPESNGSLFHHENVRGADYYAEKEDISQ